MRDLRVIGLLAGATLVKALAGLATAKIIATSVSLGQFGQLSQFMALTAFAGMFAAGGIAPGVTRVIAAHKGSVQERDWIGVITQIYMVTTVVMALAVLLFSSQLSSLVFGTDDYRWTVSLLGVTQALVGFCGLYQAFASAYGRYGTILASNAAGAIAGIVLLAVLAHYGGYEGAAIGVVLLPAMPGLALVLLKLRSLPGKVKIDRKSFDFAKVGHMFSFSAITLAGAASITLGQMAVRDLLGAVSGWEQVGYWQSTIRISDVYMQFVSVFLLSYAMPKLAGVNDAELRPAFAVIQRKVLLLFCLGGIFLWGIRHELYRLLYSAEFVGASGLLVPQLVGDAFRVVAVSISTLFMARGTIRVSLVYEILQGILLFVGTTLLVHHYGGSAPVYAYGATYLVLMVGMVLAYRARFRLTTK
ncbi:polysaccharide transporter, PST family [Cupriavidus sp. YR651]|uniref:oligosaccharide flippase family protein n=1 Tax=Cupriavidus sp. YR651 TaxID=1855315 RepID=UPI0008909FA2|nr:oligosaccharide flippase family protein [Cupriavidus sp. YR651]SDC22122.1 polysaccharide transporter, PST family [Cupriavidus sp. YR651]